MMRAIGNMLGGLRMSVKVTVMIVVALVLLSTATAVGLHKVLYESAAAQGAERQESNMRVAWSVLDATGKGFRADGDRLYLGQTLLNGNDAAVDRIKALVGGTATIFRGDMRISTNVKKEDGTRAVGTRLKQGPAHDAVLGRGESYRGTTDILGKPYFAAYDPIRDGEGRVIGVLFVGIPTHDFLTQVDAVEQRQLVIAIMVTLLAAAACMVAARVLFRPLAEMGQMMTALAQGRHDMPVPGTDRGDEIGAMAQAVEVFRENGLAKAAADQAKARDEAEQKMVVDTVSAQLADLSKGDLTVSIDAAFPPAYAALKSNFNDALARLRDLIGSVSESATAIRTGSGEIAQASEDLARRTESNAASLEETAASVTQMDGRLRASAAAATRTVERADQAIATVGGGRSVADEAVQAMGRVSDSAKGIDSVIEGLDKIAFQTRVLAMNAAVEAGRAGDAGRGFAVVADLVSALAMRAEEEAKRARDQLTVTQTDIVTAVEAVTKVDGALANISGDVAQVHELLASMAADNQAQSAAITQISAAIGTMDQSTQQNAAMVEETSAAARNLVGEVAHLADQAGRFTIRRRHGDHRTGPASRPDYRTPAAYS
jgi:methyl-accepting chemotaxis protein